MPSYSPSSIRGKALVKEFLDLLHKGAIKQAPQTPGFYSLLFVVQKDSGSWRPIIGLSTLNTFIVSQGTMLRANYCPSGLYEAHGSNIRHSPSLRYQDPPISRRLVDSSRIQDHLYSSEGQAPASVRGAGTTSESQKVITGPISGHDLSRNADPISSVHCETNRDKGSEPPQYNRGVSLVPEPPAALWRRLLGHLSSLTLLVKGGMLRMRSLQLRLRSKWNFRDDYLRIPWDPPCQEDLLWWSWAIQQRQGGDLSLPVPDLSFYSDASDVGWGAIMGEHQVSRVWTPSQKGKCPSTSGR